MDNLDNECQSASARGPGFLQPAKSSKEVSGNGSANRRALRRAQRERIRAREWRPLERGAVRRAPNLLVVGASGHVAQACLLRLQLSRSDFGRLVLLDPSDRVRTDPYLDHARLDYRFVRHRLNFPLDTPYYHGLLARHRIDIVLDVTDMDTMPILAATDAAGVSYLNTSLNDARRGVAEILSVLHPTREEARRAPHIISSGMNPGVVNSWVWHGYQRYGVPLEIVHFEYDSSTPVTGWRPMVSWSRQEFLAESIWEPTGLVSKGKVKMLPGNSLQHREELRPVMEAVVPLPSYPRALVVLHEENVMLGGKLATSSKYLYAIHPQTLDYLDQLWRERGRVAIDDLELGDNTSVPLAGSDTIGLCLDYPEARVYYVHTLANSDVSGTNATCAQVAVGVEAALSTLLAEPLSPRLYFASDLYDTLYRDIVFKRLRVEHFVLAREKRRKGTRRRPAAGPQVFTEVPEAVVI